MRAVAGVLVVMARAILWGAGIIGLTFGPLSRGEDGGWVLFFGALLILVGIRTVVADLRSGRPPERPT